MSTRTSHADANYFSVSANTYEWFAGTDKAIAALGPQAHGADFLPENPKDWDAVFKYCDGSNGHVLTALRIAQGKENAMDCNANAYNAYFEGDFGMGGGLGDQVITVKGGCHDLTFNGVVWSGGRNASVVVGNWSDQSTARSYNLDFSALHQANGQPLTFILGRCDRSSIRLPPDANVLRWKSFGLNLYWWIKRAYVSVWNLK